MRQISKAWLIGGFLWVSHAGATTDVQLILDASGSMYSRLPDGNTRISVARNALSEFVAALPENADLNVGLRIYGARFSATQEGACEDSALVVPIDGFDRLRLQTELTKAQPKGATPIVFSLRKAVQDFPKNSNKKRIVLVTDGQESCGGNLSDALLELRSGGMDIDLRVIGIDLNAQAQKAFAGLSFTNTASGTELAQALGRASDIQAQRSQVRVSVALTSQGKDVSDAQVVFVDALGSGLYALRPIGSGMYEATLPVGTYRAQMTPVGQPMQTYGGLNVNLGLDNQFAFEIGQTNQTQLTFFPKVPTAGGELRVTYKRSQSSSDDHQIGIAKKGDPEGDLLTYAWVSDSQGEVVLRVPEDVFDCEVLDLWTAADGTRRILGRSEPFSPKWISAQLNVPDSAVSGGGFRVAWTGPNNEGDYVTVVPKGAPEAFYTHYFYTRDHSGDGTLTAPVEPGTYEVRYVSGFSGKTLYQKDISVEKAMYTLGAPERAVAGGRVQVDWTGPNNDAEYITVVPLGAPEGSYTQYVYTKDHASPVDLLLPPQPGSYEIRYVNESQGAKTLARREISLVSAQYNLEVPSEAIAGSKLRIRWMGPNNEGDYITVVPKGAPEGVYTQYVYTRDGNPVSLDLPLDPGEYEVRYVSERTDPDTTLAFSEINLKAATYTLDVPSATMAGSRLSVRWTGPNNEGDYITVVPKGAPEGVYTQYVYTHDGNPTRVFTPTDPGEYEVRYVNDKTSPNRTLATKSIALTPPKATLKAATRVTAGRSIDVGWTGPAGDGDRLVVLPVGGSVEQVITEAWIGNQLTVSLAVPDRVGRYEIAYITGAGQVLVRLPIEAL